MNLDNLKQFCEKKTTGKENKVFLNVPGKKLFGADSLFAQSPRKPHPDMSDELRVLEKQSEYHHCG